MNAFTISSEPAAARVWALPTFDGVGLAEGCGPDMGAVVDEPLASDRNDRIKQSSSPSSLLYCSALRGPSHRSPRSVSRLKYISSETSPSRAALFSSLNYCVFTAPLFLNYRNAESGLSLAVNAIGKTRVARSVSWILQSAITLSSLSYLRGVEKHLPSTHLSGFLIEKMRFCGGKQIGKYEKGKKTNEFETKQSTSTHCCTGLKLKTYVR